MSAVPAGLDTDRGPTTTVPLRHFLVALGFLLAGVGAGLGLALDVGPAALALVHVHLLLAGWLCVTIMGAMTQFVPVWSGTALHSRRLAAAQLVLVAAGLGGLAAGLLLGTPTVAAGFALAMGAGFLAFVYNVGWTLASVAPLDVTERHFLFALACFAVLAPLGLALATNRATPILDVVLLAAAGIDHATLRAAHATIAVFGAVLTTVYGALYQLATMFTGTDLRGVDAHLQRLEELAHPTGVALLAGGRLVEATVPAAVGGVLVVAAAAAVAVILARRLHAATVDWTPMHTRYAVAAPALGAWAALTLPAWLAAPTAPAHLLGAAGLGHLLVLGAVGFVVFGTLYHVVPFVIWVHRYSDLLGFEPVPMIDDLYDDRLAALDGATLVAGAALVVLAEVAGASTAPRLAAVGGTLVGSGVLVFCANVALVVRRHSPHGFRTLLFGAASDLPRRLVRFE